ncbi:hypothetical protein [Myroides sp. LoEW2-1]|uniref:hypothetical protein n=1 Tax=Myroides sp. LoEW2-1 TaxID=2683192 RepID=UPI0013214962|nr:hypothetical protein [Myroides sp. LoEW2-1]MVX34783.1 hypothetical protein [Myroides sp. LoEW2-1]
MNKEFEQAVSYCIEALNIKDDKKRDKECNSLFVVSALNKALEAPYRGRGLGIGSIGYNAHRDTIDNKERRFRNKELYHVLDWLNALLTLFDLANYEDEEILKFANCIVNDNIVFNHVLKHIISNCIVKGDVEQAEQYISNFKTTVVFKEEDNFDQGYLIILQYYAMLGDEVNFFKYFKQSKPAINRYEVNEAKEFLVTNYCLKNGVEAGLTLCKHKNLGVKFHHNALMAFAEQGKYQELKQKFTEYPDLKQPEVQRELHVLTHAYWRAKEFGLAVDDDFEVMFDRATQVDRKLKWGAAKLQDVFFVNLFYGSRDNKERAVRCRKAVKNSSLKRELEIPK